MRFKALFTVLMALTLVSCSVFNNATPQPLPTVVLDNGSASAPSESQGFGGGVTASGIIAPAQEAKLASPAGGQIATVNVAVGDDVKAGDVLVMMAGRDKLNASIESANLELLSAQQDLKTLNDNAALARTAAQTRLANAQKALDDAQKKRTKMNYPHTTDELVIQKAQTDYLLAKSDYKDAQKDFNKVAHKRLTNDERAQALRKLVAAEQKMKTAFANYNWYLQDYTEIDVAQAEAELQSAQAEVESAQQAYDQLKNGPDPDAVALAEARIQNAQAQIKANQSALADLALKAPFSGTVSRLDYVSGEWVTPGQPILTIADLNHLRVETTDLSERDVPKIKIGQAVTVIVKALNQDVPGKVTDISPLADTLGGDVVYKTTIDLDTIPTGLRAGMSVDVRFDTGQ
ncbi:MAG: HlyD family efflux transporter periplasmic adaptor subunit [Anaerolineales bacterium]|jgi:HlyD family secretion protein